MNVILSVIVVLALAGVVVLVSHQGLVIALRPVDEAWADLLRELARRHELAAELATAVGPQNAAARAACEAVLGARVDAAATEDVAVRAAAETTLGRRIDDVVALIERDPDLRDDADVGRLRQRLPGLEHDIHVARAIYDARARTYATRCSLYPGRYVATWFAFPERPTFGLAERRPLDPPPL